MKVALGAVLALLAAGVTWLCWPAPGAPPVAMQPVAESPAAGDACVSEVQAAGADEQPIERRRALSTAAVGGPAIEGMVMAFPRTPVGGATVTVRGVGSSDAAALATVTTGADGCFAIAASPAWPRDLTLSVEAGGYLPHTERGVTPGHRVTIRLSPYFDLFGHVVAHGTGMPLAGVTIESGDRSGVSDANGDYELLGSGTRDMAYLVARCPGYADEPVRVRLHHRQRTRVDIALWPTATIAVEVVDAETKAAVAGAEVRTRTGGDVIARSAGGGRLELVVAPGKPASVVIRAAGYCGVVWRWTSTADPGPLRVPLPRPAVVSGQVVDERGQPLAEAQVTMGQDGRPFGRDHILPELCNELGLPGSLGLEREDGYGGTDADGRFAVQVLPDEQPYRATATHAGFAAVTSEPLLVRRAGASAHAVLAMQRGATIVGTVRCNGEPWRGDVLWRRADGSVGGATETDAKGDYDLRDVVAGTIGIVLRRQTGGIVRTASLAVAAGGRHRQDFAWGEQTSTIRGRVTESSGEPVAGVPVRAWTNERWFDTKTSEDGRYALEVAPPGPYTVWVRRALVVRTREHVAVDAAGVDFVLPQVGWLRLRVLDAATAEPIGSDAFALWGVAWRESGAEAFQDARNALDSSGLLELEVPIGRVDVSLFLTRAGYAPIVLSGLGVTGARDAEPQVVRLSRGVSVELAVADAAGFAVARKDHLVFLLERSQLAELRGPFAEQGGESNQRINGVNMWLARPGLIQQMPRFDGDGRAVLPGQAPGRYRLVVFPDDLTFTPAEFDVPEAGASVAVTWHPR